MKKNLPKELKRILITGGGGFIGGALIRFLLNKTEYQIYNLDKSGYSCDFTSINLLLKNNKDFQERYFFLNVDLKDEIKTKEAITLSNPDLVFHLAAESHVDRSIENPQDFIFSNIVGTFNLLQAALKHYKNLNQERYFQKIN